MHFLSFFSILLLFCFWKPQKFDSVTLLFPHC